MCAGTCLHRCSRRSWGQDDRGYPGRTRDWCEIAIAPRKGGRGLRRWPGPSSVFVLRGLLLLRRRPVVPDPAHPVDQRQTRPDPWLRLGQLCCQVQEVRALVVVHRWLGVVFPFGWDDLQALLHYLHRSVVILGHGAVVDPGVNHG
jgi:hypothetical protein